MQIFQSFCLKSKESIIEKFTNSQFLEVLNELLHIGNKKEGFLLILLETFGSWLTFLKNQSNECFFNVMKTFIEEKLQILSKLENEKTISQKTLSLLYFIQEVS